MLVDSQIVSKNYLIITNEDSANWIDKVKEYCKNPSVTSNSEVFDEVSEIAYEHQIDSYLAGILRASKIKE